MAWIEVMASGKALVASSAGPGPEVVEDGVSGLLVDPHDPQAIAGAVVALLDDGDASLPPRGRRPGPGRSSGFSIDQLVTLNVDHYRSVAERWRAGHG